MKKYNLFPSLVTEYNLKNLIDKDNLFETIKNYKLITHGLIKNGQTNYDENMKLLDHPNLYILKELFQEYIFKHCKELNIEPAFITNSWFNIMNEGGKTRPHIHEASCLSGVYYPLLEENTCNLYFTTPLGSSIINIIPINTIDPPLKQYTVPIKQDHLYIFPSYLQHGTQINKSKTRIVISFNSFI